VLVRGLGCRPSEALSLSWDTVFLDPGFEKVRFLDTKDGRKTGRPHRTAPVLFEWVRQTLVEMKERHGRPGGPVCPNFNGKPFQDDSSHSQMIRDILRREGRPAYTLKKMQKYYITQLIQAGFPPHVVAFWTGHTLTVQERHYIEENAYLPQAERDYGELSVLSSHGKTPSPNSHVWLEGVTQGVTFP
jgi:integrase